MDTEYKSVYTRGAEDGLVMGLCFIAMFIMQLLGRASLIAGIAGNLMALGVPLLLYLMLRRSYRTDKGRSTFSSLWMHGIMTFLCGSLLLAAIMYLYLRFIEPTFIADTVRDVVSVYRAIGSNDAEKIADVLQSMIDRHMLPSPIALTFSALWLGSFSGAVISLIEAAIVKLVKPYTPDKINQ